MEGNKKLDVIILAGDHKKNIKLYSDNKGFLIVENIPIIIHILNSLINVKEISNIIIVGPKERLDNTLNKHRHKLNKTDKSIITVEQKDNILQNAWEGFFQSIPEYANNSLSMEQIKNKYMDKPVLFLSVDVPMVMPEEISYFIAKCDLNKYDYFTGITPREVMSLYYPTETQPGIIMAYLHFKENLYRVSNIHLVKPFRIKDIEYINLMYDIRYQKKIINVLLFIINILDAPNTLELCIYYINMQMALFLSHIKLKSARDFFRKFVILNNVEKAISLLIGAEFKAIEIPFGGLALDIDNEKDFNTLVFMFKQWKEKQRTHFKT
ncbi:MAG: hypothetical protein HY934_05460 [Candidatus Firestonebacteria bacterium]|nr:hypothetical protein [Candidatus Firestonebacteria bacterium]